MQIYFNENELVLAFASGTMRQKTLIDAIAVTPSAAIVSMP